MAALVKARVARGRSIQTRLVEKTKEGAISKNVSKVAQAGEIVELPEDEVARLRELGALEPADASAQPEVRRVGGTEVRA
ncbi:hypothetical protein [Acidocella sp.]|uniref:hypothetical protein n=1 Tax=Acidocella sp. TaxID=50710 RepID=UPI002618E080|nr:hypothetical protein [Acidocella sp.]